MPYIKPERRAALDVIIDGVVKHTPGLTNEQMRRLVANIVTKSLTTFGTAAYTIEATLDGIVSALCRRINTRGEANYALCRIVLETMKPASGWGYESLSDVVSILEGSVDCLGKHIDTLEPDMAYGCISACYDAADEIKRRLLGPYEDTAIRKNGDMACFANESFAYLPPLDFTFDELAGGCCGCKREMSNEPLDLNMSNLVTFPPVAEACCEVYPPIAEAFTQEQIDAVERAARKTG